MRSGILSAVSLAVFVVGWGASAQAQTLADTLSFTYSNNPTLNAARSTGRSADEGVAIALSGYRPTVSATASSAYAYGNQVGLSGSRTERDYVPQTIGVSLVQPLFQGFQVSNGVKQSEASVRAQRETIRNTEQTVLLQAVTAFGDVIRDTALQKLAESSVSFLTEQVRAARDRFNVGEGTRTDVAQAEARLQQSVAQLNAAKSNLAASRATYRQIVGVEAKSLSGGVPLGPLSPKTAEAGVSSSQQHHPAILASLHNVDVASFNVKVIEGTLLPSLNLQGSASYGNEPSLSARESGAAQVGLSLSVPLYQGGREYARVRQAKEQLGTARIQVDQSRDQVRQLVISAWGQRDASAASIEAAKAQIEATELALSGVIEEQRVGQRTTLDVLNAQNEVVNARSALATATRNNLVASFTLVAAVGKLDAESLNLKVTRYAPEQHYDQVRDKWFGLRTPDGR